MQRRRIRSLKRSAQLLARGGAARRRGLTCPVCSRRADVRVWEGGAVLGGLASRGRRHLRWGQCEGKRAALAVHEALGGGSRVAALQDM